MNFKTMVVAVVGLVFLAGCGHYGGKHGKCGCGDCGTKTECSMDKDGKACGGDCQKKSEEKKP